MHIHLLGSAAGGGFPQWNCNCHNCGGFRRGEITAHARSQSSITVSADGERWVLINASPDIRSQIEAFPPLHPRGTQRGTGIAAVILVDSQIDHTSGLLFLREGSRLPIYCTQQVHADLTTGFPVLNMLQHYCGVDWQKIDPGVPMTVTQTPGLRFYPIPLTSKAPPYSPHRHDPHLGDNIGLKIEDTRSGRYLFYAPGLGQMEPHLEPIMAEADCLLIDGTAWSDDEMARYGVGTRRARDMGHLYLDGPGGTLEWLRRFPRPRKILIHINNTNPVLNENSPERASVAAAGIELAYDGMDIEL